MSEGNIILLINSVYEHIRGLISALTASLTGSFSSLSALLLFLVDDGLKAVDVLPVFFRFEGGASLSSLSESESGSAAATLRFFEAVTLGAATFFGAAGVIFSSSESEPF